MPLPATISPAVLAAVVGHLTPHFLSVTEGDPKAARQAASDILAAYNVETEAELAVAAEIISLSFHALDALSQAANPDLPLNKVLRLRGGAVSLSRESHKARRRLDQLQRSRLTAVAGTLPAVTQPADEPAPLTEATKTRAPDTAHPPPTPVRPTPIQNTGANPHQAWTTAQPHCHTAQRMTETNKRNQAEHARHEAEKIPAVHPGATNQPAM